ncbi:MAG: family 20 glycosylhydrolase, partial [Bacteroidales bacterium]
MKNLLQPIFIAFALSSCTFVEKAKLISIIPEPVSIDSSVKGEFTVVSGATISVNDPNLLSIAQYYKSSIELTNGLKLKIAEQQTNAAISLNCTLEHENLEAYTFVCTEKGITINAASAKGLIMAASTLQQLLPNNAKKGAKVPFINITDFPRFEYRGTHLDVSRHFYSVEQVKSLLNQMARYKLNKFHWHLTDDQGWRIEIKQYPLLTDSGAYRRFNNQDRQCMTYEKDLDNSMFQLPKEFLKINGADTLYGGYYTQEEIKEVVEYAAQRGIDVLPELDMPGHLMAAIIGYPFLSCNNEAKWGASFSDPLCVGNDSALQMVKNIYTELATLFPYEYLHLGADEVEKTNWKKCPRCQAKIKKHKLKNEEELQAWFVKDMEAHFNSLGKKLIGWDEIEEGGLSKTATIMWWRDWAPKVVPQATAQGNKVIMSPCFSMYFDAWESENTLQNTYKFDPVLPTLNTKQAKNIIGVQGNLWCETIPTVSCMQHQYYPRILALAEIAWSPKELRNWEHFFEKLKFEITFLDFKKINYRLPNLKGFFDINAFTDSTKITVSCSLPNIAIHYTTDGSNPNLSSPLYTSALTITESTNFTFRGFRPDGTVGEMYKASYLKEDYASALDIKPAKKGLQVKQYDYKGVYHKKQCELIDKDTKLVKQYILDSLNLTAEIKGFMGLIAVGYIHIEKDGIYTFALKANDGSTLSINNTILIDNDGTHGDKEMTAQKALAKGWHKVEVRYFDLNNGGCL